MRELARAGPWAKKLAQAAAARQKLESSDWYYRLLKPHASRVDIWRTTYHHVLPSGPAAIIDWFKGTGLRPFLAPLDTPEQSAFLAAFSTGLAALYPPDPDGTVLLPFPRLFFIATI
jgi:trans-aconitate 2-methyltransferase